MPQTRVKKFVPAHGRRAKDIDLILPGLDAAIGRRPASERDRDRFRVSSETKDATVYARRVQMIRDLAARLMWPILAARLETPARFSTTQLYDAYRRGGERALHDLLERSRGKMLAPLVDAYLTAKGKRKTIRKMRQQLHRFLDFVGPDATTEDFTSGTVEKYLAQLRVIRTGKLRAEHVSNSTTNRYRAILGAFASWAVRNGHITRHPIAYRAVEKAEEHRTHVPKMEPAEVAALIRAVHDTRPDFVLFTRLLIHTGADFTEVQNSRVTHYVLGPRPRVRYIREKTYTPERHVPIPSDLAMALRAHFAAHGYRTGDRPFAGVPYRSYYAALRKAARDIGRGDIKVKSLRHVAAILWRWAGVDLVLVQKWLGHATLVQTQVYADYGPDPEREAPFADRVSAMLASHDPNDNQNSEKEVGSDVLDTNAEPSGQRGADDALSSHRVRRSVRTDADVAGDGVRRGWRHGTGAAAAP